MSVETSETAGPDSRRLFVYNGGFWFKPRLRRILSLAGWQISFGRPKAGDFVGIWGASPTAWRGRRVADHYRTRLVTVEDAFLRSIFPGRSKESIARRGPIGLLIDPDGLHFDPHQPSRIETLVHSAAAASMSAEACEGIARLRHLDMSKYNTHDPSLSPPPAGYVLVIDQTLGDASLMGAGRARFLEMLTAARDENPGARIVVRSHPETAAGLRPGHILPQDLFPGEVFCDTPLSPWKLTDNADAVYAVSSQLGYEALLAGHEPRLFGLPFYAGWGLSKDEQRLPESRRGRATREALFAASHLLAPVWYDPCRDQLCDFNTAVDQLTAEIQAFRQDRNGHLAYGMRLWKRPFLAKAFGNGRGVKFTNNPSPDVTLAWAGKADALPCAIRVEDGFLRSRGLGAELTPPVSLVADDLGIYYDPTQESRLEYLIAASPPPGAELRTIRLIQQITAARLSKYNLSDVTHDLPDVKGNTCILVPGQVEDDASIRLGAGAERSNLALMRRVRQENPDAFVIYKPHPDVEAGLRPGLIAPEQLSTLADYIATRSDPIALLDHVDELWTITSTMGFEALLRNVPVTTLGAPFYAGWGLTRDLGTTPDRRKAQPELWQLVHASLVGYPRYFDPVSNLPCPVEVALDRLADPDMTRLQKPALRLLAKLQGAMAGHAWIWRR